MTEINWIEVRERVEQAIATLTTRRVADGYELELSGKALASWEEGGGVLEFSRQSGIPLDWLLLGDVGALICASAAGSTRSELTQACGAPPVRPSWVLMIDHPTPDSFCKTPVTPWYSGCRPAGREWVRAALRCQEREWAYCKSISGLVPTYSWRAGPLRHQMEATG